MEDQYYYIETFGLETDIKIDNKKYIGNIDKDIESVLYEYLENNRDIKSINVNRLTRFVKTKFTRRKNGVIKNQICTIIAKLCRKPSLEIINLTELDPVGYHSSNCTDISSDQEEVEPTKTIPTVSDSLLELYKTLLPPHNENKSEQELIHVSSDDDLDENSESVIKTFTLDEEQSKNQKDISRKRKFQSTSMPNEVSFNSPLTNGVSAVSTPTNANLKNKRFKKKTTPSKSIVNSDKSMTDKDTTLQDNIPSITFNDIAGYDNILCEIVGQCINLCHPEVYKPWNIKPPIGILLHGPPGCGKTLMAHAIAGTFKVPLIDVPAPELVAGVSGVSEQRIRKLFENAVKKAPCVLFIDEIDCITQNRENANREMEKRIVAQLLTSFDRLHDSRVLVIGATNSPDSLDPALRRAGRFEREFCVGIPNKESRYRIIKLMCKEMNLAQDVDLEVLATNTPGYVAADLQSLIRESAMASVNRVIGNFTKSMTSPSSSNGLLAENSSYTQYTIKLKQKLDWMTSKEPIDEILLKDAQVTLEDVKLARKRVQPSSKREGFATVPDVTWDDVGSLHKIRKELESSILNPIKYPELHDSMGLPLLAGILLFGPPGCGKTLLAKAIANEAGINFIPVKGPELLNKYVGESEKLVRDCFRRARGSPPCVIFFDEIDALCPRRSDTSENSAGTRVVNQLLTEMDGVESREGVYLLAATNRPDIIDPAILRPGRLAKTIYVGFPEAEDRIDILRTLTKNGTKPPMENVSLLSDIAKNPLCEGFTGADLAALVHDASRLAVNEIISNQELAKNLTVPRFVTETHFTQALKKLRPSVSKKDRLRYEKSRLEFGTSAYELENNKIRENTRISAML